MTASLPGRTPADTIFFRALAITTAIRCVLAALVPLTGDEAYFVVWGAHLDHGYYDHTPMAGWWLAAMLALGKSTLLMRLPALLTTVFVAWAIWRAAREFDAARAGWVGALYLWSPHNLMNFFTTTDTPLLLFSVLAGLQVFRAVRSDRAWEYLTAGLLLGLAFLSKYFAVLLGVAMAVLLLVLLRPRRWWGLVCVFVGVLPSAAVNILWNHEHGWSNILFNLYNRTSDAGFSVGQVLLYIAVVLLPLAPVAWSLLRPRVAGRLGWREAWARWQAEGSVVYVALVLVPLALLLVVSLQKPVGAHWPLAFMPFLFIAITSLFTGEALQRMTRGMRLFGGGLAGLAGVLLLLPTELLRSHKSYDSVVLGTHTEDVLDALEPHLDTYRLMTFSYAKSAILSFAGERYVPVIGPGSYHGRQDDLITDFRAFDGQDILVLCDTRARAALARQWFAETDELDVVVRGAHFRAVLGRGFRYAFYRETVLLPVAQRYYSMPEWLAKLAKPSFFAERYGVPPELMVRRSGDS